MLRLLILTALLSACASTSNEVTPEGDGTKGVETKPVVTETVRLSPDRLRLDEAKGEAVLEANTRVRSATYTTWIFELASYKKVLGDAAVTEPVVVNAQVMDKQVQVKQPSSKDMASPEGGFRYVTIKARILSKQ